MQCVAQLWTGPGFDRSPLRPDPGGRLGGSSPILATVLVKAAPEAARTIAGQHLLQALINLLARQFGVVRAVLLEVPHPPVHAEVFLCPPVRDGGLVAALLASSASVGNGQTVTSAANSSPITPVACVGEGLDPTTFGVPGIVVTGGGWRASARTTGPVVAFEAGSTNPLGPHLAATIGAGFTFKAAYGKHRSVDSVFSLWSRTGRMAPRWRASSYPRHTSWAWAL